MIFKNQQLPLFCESGLPLVCVSQVSQKFIDTVATMPLDICFAVSLPSTSLTNGLHNHEMRYDSSLGLLWTSLGPPACAEAHWLWLTRRFPSFLDRSFASPALLSQPIERLCIESVAAYPHVIFH